MKKNTLISAVLTACILPVAAQAAAISWGSATNITADTDVSLNGTSVWAYSFGATGSFDVNGVTFAGDAGFSNADLTTTLTNSHATAFAGTGGIYATLGADYQSILSSAAYQGGAGSATITLNGLTIGQQYEFQFWANDSRNRSDMANRYETIGGTTITLLNNTSGANADGGVGQFVIGTFTADATSQTFELESVPNVLQLNAGQLRSVPEPSSYALLAGVLGLSMVMLRRRK